MRGRARTAKAKFFMFTTNISEAKKTVREFIEFFSAMKELFNGKFYNDFRKKDFIERKKLEQLQEDYYFIHETHAKLSLLNVSIIINDIVQEIGKNVKNGQGLKIIEVKFNEENINPNLKNNTKLFTCRLRWDYQLMDLNDSDKLIISKKFPSKDLARNCATIMLIKILHERE